MSPDDHILIRAIKLELGDHQTLAEEVDGTWRLLDPPPNKALELLKCQRYFMAMGQAFLPVRTLNAGKGIAVYCQVPAKMRANPTVIAPAAVGEIVVGGQLLNNLPAVSKATMHAIGGNVISVVMNIDDERIPGLQTGWMFSDMFYLDANL